MGYYDDLRTRGEVETKLAKLYDLLSDSERAGGKNFVHGNAVGLGVKHDPATVAPVGPYATGNGGLFRTPGQHPTVFSALMLPYQGALNDIPVNFQGASAPDDPAFGGFDSPYYTSITGVTQGDAATFANQPTNTCDDPPTAGLLKSCILTAPYGRFQLRTRQLDVRQVGRLLNAGDPTNLMVQSPLIEQTPFTPGIVPPGTGSAVLMEINKRLIEMGTDAQRLLGPLVYTGDPTNNTAGDGGKQFQGLDILINAGNKRDVATGNVCTALDSELYDFGFGMVNATAAASNDIVHYLDSALYLMDYYAETTGNDPLELVLYMRPELFDEIVKVWPVRYYEEGLAQMAAFGAGGGRFQIAANEFAEFRDRMRNGSFLWHRGRPVRVVRDSFIAYDTNVTNANLGLGQYASDIYGVAMNANGQPVTWWEYFNFGNMNAQRAMNLLGQDGTMSVSDGGIFLWMKSVRNGCLQYHFNFEPRIIHRASFLSFRIQNVGYEPLRAARQPLPSDDYYRDGGATANDAVTGYAEWSGATPQVLG